MRSAFRLKVMFTLADLLPDILPHLPEGPSLTPLPTLLRHFAPCSGGGFEYRLQETAQGIAPIDFSLKVSRQDAQRHCLGEKGDVSPGIGRAFTATSEFWQRLHHVFRQWAATESPWFPAVLALWLEFDAQQYEVETPLPLVFLELAPMPEALPIAINMLQQLVAHGQAEPDFSYLARFQANTTPVYLALLRPPRPNLLRAAFPVSKSTRRLFLQHQGWVDLPDDLAAVLAFLDDLPYQTLIDLDIDEAAPSSIGLEILFDRTNLARPIFDFLVERGWCLPQRRLAVLNWAGYPPQLMAIQQDQDVLLYPPDVSRAVDLAITCRTTSHVKLVFDHHGFVTAKAYLYAGYCWNRQDFEQSTNPVNDLLRK